MSHFLVMSFFSGNINNINLDDINFIYFLRERFKNKMSHYPRIKYY